ncbi:MAG TPA: rhomboid family intramembrane serine protease [Actinomycetes bacterium]|nr:rhomboid family intramembrane serine protease [Actinomycetes bacterium]
MADPAAPDDRPAWLREGAPQPPRQEPPRPPPPRPPVPVVTWSVLAVNAVMLVVTALLSGGSSGFVEPSPRALCRLGALNAAAIAEGGQWWRLLTVMVLHGGVLHFALNSYALWVFGPLMERALGSLRMAAVYLVGGFAGSAASFAFTRTTLGVGASGAIFGLLGGLVAFLWRRRDRGGMSQLRSVLLIVAINLVFGLSIPNIDNLAHVGGFVGGLVAVWLLEAVPRRPLAQLGALAVPVAASLALVWYGAATLPPGTFSCAQLG